MNNDVLKLRRCLERQRGQRVQIEQNITELQQAVRDQTRALRRHEEAREIIHTVGLQTQNQISFHIEGITTLALSAVFDDPYELKIEFVPRRNTTECDIYFVRDGNRINPKNAAGVGAVDVSAFALRVACWMMTQPRPRAVILMDEPFKHLKGEEANRRVLEMVKQITTRLGLQIIMISDERVSREATIAATDRLLETTINRRVTHVEMS